MAKKFIIDNQLMLSPDSVSHEDIESVWYPGKLIKEYRFNLNTTNQEYYDFIKDKIEGLSVQIEGNEEFVGVVSNVRMLRSSTTNGDFIEGEFEIKISQPDIKPIFEQVEINKNNYQVLDYNVEDTYSSIIHTFLVKTSSSSFRSLNKLLHNAATDTSISRIGIDELPFQCKLGGRLFWSEHDENGCRYVKQVIRCFIDKEDSEPMNLACGIRQSNLEKNVLFLNMKLNFLIKKLLGNLFSEEEQKIIEDILLLENELKMSDEYWDGLDRVNDAANHM